MQKDDCIFCKIANGEIPAATIYEDDDFRVILDVCPATKGHALILPKKHFKDIYELDAHICEKVLPLAKKIVCKLSEVLQCEGYNILQNNGSKAGQTVFHYHMHLIPRYEEDKVKLTWTPGELKEVEEKLLQIRW